MSNRVQDTQDCSRSEVKIGHMQKVKEETDKMSVISVLIKNNM